MNENYHIPVMRDACIDALNIKPNGVYVDCTFGGGGHAQAILNKLDEAGKLFAFDQDSDVLPNLIENPKLIFISENFKYLKRFLKLNGIKKVDGILADLGVSSHQIDEATRGFSFRFENDLDMRMNSKDKTTAKDVVNTYSASELADVFYYYGEINNARKIASIIATKRKENKIDSSNQLIEIINPWVKGNRNKYLAKVFQALRIEVNKELEALKEMLDQAIELLKEKGRLVVLTYHSLEDRIVKNFIKAGNAEGKIAEDFFGNKSMPLKKINRKPILASAEELKQNNRARSAKLRIAEKK